MAHDKATRCCKSCCAAQSTKFMLGIIIAVICSNWVGEAINSDGIYETDLEADGTVIFLRPSPPHTLYTKTAADIAARAVWCVPGSLGAKAAQLWLRLRTEGKAVAASIAQFAFSTTNSSPILWCSLVVLQDGTDA